MRTVRVHLSEGRWFRGTVANVSEHYTTVIVTDTGTVDERLGAHRICSNARIQEDTDGDPDAQTEEKEGSVTLSQDR